MDTSTLLYLSKLANGSANMANMAMSNLQKSNSPSRNGAKDSANANISALMGNLAYDPMILNSMAESYLRRMYSDPTKFPLNPLSFASNSYNSSVNMNGSSASSPSSSSTSSSSVQSSFLSNSLVSQSPSPSQSRNKSSFSPLTLANSAQKLVAPTDLTSMASKLFTSQFNLPVTPKLSNSSSSSASRFGIADILGLSSMKNASSPSIPANKAHTSSPIISPKSSTSSSSSATNQVGKASFSHNYNVKKRPLSSVRTPSSYQQLNMLSKSSAVPSPGLNMSKTIHHHNYMPSSAPIDSLHDQTYESDDEDDDGKNFTFILTIFNMKLVNLF